MANPPVATGGAANKIVVIGGGVAGSYIAKSLQFHGNVTLIDPYGFLFFSLILFFFRIAT